MGEGKRSALRMLIFILAIAAGIAFFVQKDLNQRSVFADDMDRLISVREEVVSDLCSQDTNACRCNEQGCSLEFDGNSVSLPFGSFPYQSGTISARVWPRENPRTVPHASGSILSSQGQFVFGLDWGKPYFAFFNGKEWHISRANLLVQVETWTMIAVSFGVGDNVRFYVNGRKVGEDSIWVSSFSSGEATLGFMPGWEEDVWHFRGLVSEIRILEGVIKQ